MRQMLVAVVKRVLEKFTQQKKKKRCTLMTTPACDYYYSYLMQVARNPSATELQMRRYNITRQQQKRNNT